MSEYVGREKLVECVNRGTGICVVARKDEPFENMMKRFKRKLKRNRVMVELRDREFYIQPSEVRRKKRRLSKLRMQRHMQELRGELEPKEKKEEEVEGWSNEG